MSNATARNTKRSKHGARRAKSFTTLTTVAGVRSEGGSNEGGVEMKHFDKMQVVVPWILIVWVLLGLAYVVDKMLDIEADKVRCMCEQGRVK